MDVVGFVIFLLLVLGISESLNTKED